MKHQLASCILFSHVRKNMYNTWLKRPVMFTSLHSTIRTILTSDDSSLFWNLYISPNFCLVLCSCKHIEHLSYLTRTFAFDVDEEYRKLVKQLEINPPFNKIRTTDLILLTLSLLVPVQCPPVQ